MKIEKLGIPDILLITLDVHGDNRGFFLETFNKAKWTHSNLPEITFVQDNISFSENAGTIRGLHYQVNPNAQAKLFHCLQGAVLDVVVDIRKNSPHFGKKIQIELKGGSGQQLFIPAGFAHGFATLMPNTLVQYKVTSPYNPAAERGIRWDDSILKIDWRVPLESTTISERDKKWPTWEQAELF